MKSNSKLASLFNALFGNFAKLPLSGRIENTVKAMNTAEKILFYFVCLIFSVSGLILLARVHNSYLVEVPTNGGDFTEGLTGSPRFINPILSLSDTDRDLTAIVYSGLLKKAVDGNYVTDLASSYTVGDDGTVYDFKIRDNAFFHDGVKVTADDVLFTVQKALDPVIKSQRRPSWEGVGVEKVSSDEVRFTLSKPYSPFLETLTMGILPKHIWENVSSEEFPFSEFNINPVGSGPYKISQITRNGGGIPTTLKFASNKNYVLGQPKIKNITFKFFQNEGELLKAYDGGGVDSVAGVGPTALRDSIKSDKIVSGVYLPRVFGVFFNQNAAPVLVNPEVRQALEISAPKKKIVDEVLYGYGRVLNGPVPSSFEQDSDEAQGSTTLAKAILEKAGWKINADGYYEKKTKSGTSLLSFSISTSDTQELKDTAEILRGAWTELGAKIDVKVFEPTDLTQNIIRGRKYDALLFGEQVDEGSDLYPFWHSSARNDPGLNISLYTNITVDKLLEQIQNATSTEDILAKKQLVLSEIKKDTPAVFLFTPALIYVPANSIKNISLKNISYQNEIFLSLNEWYIETDRVWKFFAPA